MTDPTELLAAYFQLMNCNGASHVYREAVRLGILDALDAGPLTAAEVAERCAAVARPTELVLEALASLGLVKRIGSAYGRTPLAFLVLSSSYRNLGDEYWEHLPTLLKTGAPLVRMDDPAQNEIHYQAQAAMLGWMLTPAAQSAAELLLKRLPENAAILDLGAGSAVWSLTLAGRLPRATVTAVDWPAVLEVAKESAKERGLADRFTTLAGNLHEVELSASQFDLVIVANVSHLLSPDGNAALLSRVRATLRAHGYLALIDVFPGLPQGDLNRTLYAVGLALRTQHGRVYSVEEMKPLLERAGFAEPQPMPLPVPPFAVGMLLVSVR